jgi:choline dehydrogenase-like flavoprotein
MPWEGTDAHAALMRDARHLSPFIAVTRDGGEGRTTLTRSGRVRVDYRLDASGIATLRHATVRLARLARAAEASEIMAAGTPPLWFRGSGGAGGAGAEQAAFLRFEARLAAMDFSANRGSVFSAHQMGSVRAGADPREHPCDPRGRVRRGADVGSFDQVVGGLYVADTSLFPTGLGVNPLLTAMALARRVARTVLAEG